MADFRHRNRDRSIFSEDSEAGESWRGDRWRSEDYGWGGDPDRTSQRGDARGERGFFERAGDEVKSWFGDDGAEHRREQDARRDERAAPPSGASRGGFEDQWTGRPAERSTGSDRSRHDPGRGGYGQSDLSKSLGSGQAFAPSGLGESHHDESYRRWRDQQIAELDREYDEYRRHRQQQFEQDFGSFRQERANQQAASQQPAGDTAGAAPAGSETVSAETGAANSGELAGAGANATRTTRSR